MSIDWSRVAQPQEDGYDSAVTLAEARSRLHYERPCTEISDPSILTGHVAVRPLPATVALDEGLYNERHDHPNLTEAVALMDLWPLGRDQFKALVDTFSPLNHQVYGALPGAWGSTSGRWRFGWVYVTVFDPVGLCEGMLHEMGHHKLEALGVGLEKAERLVANDPSELYVSPVRKDTKRPMSAVLHAQYSWTYLTEFDLALAAVDRQRAQRYLVPNVARLQEGIAEMRQYARWDEPGEAFAKSFYAWCDSVIERGLQIGRS